jgi:hypothetical protein
MKLGHALDVFSVRGEISYMLSESACCSIRTVRSSVEKGEWFRAALEGRRKRCVHIPDPAQKIRDGEHGKMSARISNLLYDFTIRVRL